MSSGETSFTSLGKLMLWGCVAVGIIAAIVLKEMMGYDGIMWGAIFGGGGGLVGGIVGQVLANLTGQVEKSGGGRGPGVGRR